MILTAHQPAYLPWAGLIHKIYLSDTFVYFDDVQYVPKDFMNRNYIFNNGSFQWLTVPVFTKNHREKKIHQIEINHQLNWKRKHIKSLEISYSKTPYFKKYYGDLVGILSYDWVYFADLNLKILKYILKQLNINKNILRAKDFNFKGQKSELIVDMCKELSADNYIFGEQGINYANIELFKENNIDLYFQNFSTPKYKINNTVINENLSIIDIMFRYGANRTMDLILKSNKVYGKNF